MAGLLQRVAGRHNGDAPRKGRGRASRAPALIAVVFVTAAAVAGAVLASLLVDSFGAPGEDSAEAGFARDMTVHHAQAVEMAEIVRDRTESEEIKTLAADISLTQQGQIGQMEGWLAVWGLSPSRTGPAMEWMGHPPVEGLMPGMATPEEISSLREASPEEMDARFLRLMIEHHEAALPMAGAALELSDRPEVDRLARAIAASQGGEISAMQEMLEDRGESAGPDAAGGEDPHSHDGGGDHEH